MTFRSPADGALGARLCRLTVNLKPGKGFHFALLVGGGADVSPGIRVDDPRNRQDVYVLETLGGKFSFQLDRSRFEFLCGSSNSETVTIVTLDHLISGVGYPDATQGKTASEPTVTSFFSGSTEI